MNHESVPAEKQFGEGNNFRRSFGRRMRNIERLVPGVKKVAGRIVTLDDSPSKRTNPTNVIEYRAGEVCEAASTNKNAIGLAVRIAYGGVSDEELLSMRVPLNKIKGAGVFDQDEADSAATIPELMHDMLANSSNTAAKTLVTLLGGVDTVNTILGSAGYRETRLRHGQNPGEVDYGFTTPTEATSIVMDLIEGDDIGNRSLKVAASMALQLSSSKRYGVGPVVDDQDLALAEKSGQWNMDADPSDPSAVRNSVFVLYDSNQKPRAVSAIFTSSNNDISAEIADRKVGHIGALLAEELGIPTMDRRKELAFLAKRTAKGMANTALELAKRAKRTAR